MPGIAQRRVKLSGTWYDAGEPVPDELVDERSVLLGLVTRAAPAADVAAELAEAKARAEAAEARFAALEASVEARLSAITAQLGAAPAPAAGDQGTGKPAPKAPRTKAAKEAGGSPATG